MHAEGFVLSAAQDTLFGARLGGRFGGKMFTSREACVPAVVSPKADGAPPEPSAPFPSWGAHLESVPTQSCGPRNPPNERSLLCLVPPLNHSACPPTS